MKANSTKMMTGLLLMAVMLLAMGCEKTVAPKVAMVESSAVLGYDKAVVVAQVVDDGHGTITERGFCYGKSGETPDTLLCPGNENPFSVELTDLLPTTEYFCTAFAVNEAGRGSSEAFVFTTLELPGLEVKTYDLTDITYHSAEAHGRVENIGGPTVLECGVCYSTEENPTIDDIRVVADVTIGLFDCPVRDLSSETWYYLRAYVVCSDGPHYGKEKSFLTDVLPMEVHTEAISDVTATRAKVEGMVIRDGGYEVLESGFCWGTEHNPTVDGLHSKAGIGMIPFSLYISGFERGRTHYVRAYAINEKGVAYGEEVEFVPDDMSTPWPEGTLPGLFSVSPDRRVRFSQGNLQFYPDENLWRFAERQWDYVGGQVEDPYIGTTNLGTVYANGAKCNNDQTWKYYEGWMDLFGWGTSGWDNGNEYYHPYDFAACHYHCASYGPAGNYDLTGDYAESDWGVHNTISNGGSRQWYTPSREELVYLITERETPSGMRFAKAVVAGVSGMVLLPDDWDASTYLLNAVNEHCNYTVNRVTGREWLEVLEPAGAVFLPGAGERYQVPLNNDIIYDNTAYNGIPSNGSYWTINGSYWTTTQSGVCIAYALVLCNNDLGGQFFETGYMGIEASRRCGRSVRLISEE